MPAAELLRRLALLLKLDPDLWVDHQDGQYVIVDRDSLTIGRGETLAESLDGAESYLSGKA